jgi:hypothetical protein
VPVVTENTTKTPPAHVCSKRGGGCLLIIPILIAPRFHPTSSCLWRQLGVLSWWWFSGVVSVCHRHHRHSPSLPLPIAAAACRRPTHDPPHEQLLMRLGAGCVISCSLPVPSLLLSTLRAEARNGDVAVLLTVLSRCYSSIRT